MDNLSRNSFFDNSDFDFCGAGGGGGSDDDSPPSPLNDEDGNFMSVSFWNPHVHHDRYLAGVIKIYANEYLPESVLEFTYDLEESSQAQLEYQTKNIENDEFVSLNQSYRRFTGIDHPNNYPRVTSIVHSKIKVVPARSIKPQMNIIRTFFTRKTPHRLNDSAIIDPGDAQPATPMSPTNQLLLPESLDLSSNRHLVPSQLNRSIVSLHQKKSIAPSEFETPCASIILPLSQIFRPNSSHLADSNLERRKIYQKNEVIYYLRSPVERSALLLIPFRIHFKNRTLLFSAKERFEFRKNNANAYSARSQLPQFFSINVSHNLTFSLKKSKQETKESSKQEMKATQEFYLHPNLENFGPTPRQVEKDIVVHSSFYACICRRPKVVRITVYLDRTVFIRNNYNANVTISYHKDILYSYKLLQFVVYQIYQSKEQADSYKESEVLSEEVDMNNKFMASAMDVFEFVYRIPLEKAAQWTLQSVEVRLLGVHREDRVLSKIVPFDEKGWPAVLCGRNASGLPRRQLDEDFARGGSRQHVQGHDPAGQTFP